MFESNQHAKLGETDGFAWGSMAWVERPQHAACAKKPELYPIYRIDLRQ